MCTHGEKISRWSTDAKQKINFIVSLIACLRDADSSTGAWSGVCRAGYGQIKSLGNMVRIPLQMEDWRTGRRIRTQRSSETIRCRIRN